MSEKRRRVLSQQHRDPEKPGAEKRGRLTDRDTKGVKKCSSRKGMKGNVRERVNGRLDGN